MATYLVIEIEDNGTATALRKKLSPLENKGVRIIGAFLGPKDYCDCQPPDPTKYTRNDNVVGARLGWLIHEPCRRPKRGLHQLKNLLNLAKIHWREDDLGYTLVPTLTLHEVRVRNMVKNGRG